MKTDTYEWSMGNGQCPVCYGSKPDSGWWTDHVGHEKDCSLADLMKDAGRNPTYKYLNPERSVGCYSPKGSHFICQIRHNDPERDEKLKLGKDLWK